MEFEQLTIDFGVAVISIRCEPHETVGAKQAAKARGIGATSCRIYEGCSSDGEVRDWGCETKPVLAGAVR
jgi:hypothetical protein